jgi:hypothetical protein
VCDGCLFVMSSILAGCRFRFPRGVWWLSFRLGISFFFYRPALHFVCAFSGFREGVDKYAVHNSRQMDYIPMARDFLFVCLCRHEGRNCCSLDDVKAMEMEMRSV